MTWWNGRDAASVYFNGGGGWGGGSNLIDQQHPQWAVELASSLFSLISLGNLSRIYDRSAGRILHRQITVFSCKLISAWHSMAGAWLVPLNHYAAFVIAILYCFYHPVFHTGMKCITTDHSVINSAATPFYTMLNSEGLRFNGVLVKFWDSVYDACQNLTNTRTTLIFGSILFLSFSTVINYRIMGRLGGNLLKILFAPSISACYGNLLRWFFRRWDR